MSTLMKKIAGCFLAAALAAGLVPAAALAQPEPAVGMPQQVQLDDDSQASTGVFVDVLDDFRLIDHTPSFSVNGTDAVLDFTGGRLFATLDGGSGVASAVWKVTGADGAVREFAAQQEAGGKWVLPLSADGAAGTLGIAAPCEYTCVFAATDRSGSTVSCTVVFQVLTTGETSDYGAKTIYKDHAETTDGVATFAEPSATGLIHEYVQRLASTSVSPGSSAWEALARMAADYAAANNQQGAYSFCTAWSLAALFTHEVPGDPAAYKGDLSVVIPVPDDGPAAGAQVVVFGYGADGARTPFTAVVQQQDGVKYVKFDTAELGTYGIASYAPDATSAVRVTASVQGAGFVNYEGTYTWPRTDVKRYVFSAVPGHRLAQVSVMAGGAAISVPDSAYVTGFFDFDLTALPADVTEASIMAVFEPVGDAGQTHTLSAVVAGGTGRVLVNGIDAEGKTFPVTRNDEVQLAFTPTSPSASIEYATISIGGGAPIELNVVGGRAVVSGIEADAVVSVVFSSEQPVPPLSFSVAVNVVGGHDGHGSVDAPYGNGSTQVSVARTVAEGDDATFALHPQAGYAVYTVMDGTVELGGLLASSASGLILRLPDVHRDHQIWVTFRKMEEKPPVIPADKYVTVDVEASVEPGSAFTELPTITPPSAILPKGGSYDSFAIIPASSKSVLSRVLVKGASELAWRDATAQAVWVEWPQKPAGATSSGYYAFAVRNVGEDTFVRAIFRDARPDDPVREPTPTRNVRINVTGEGGTVSPNTVGKPPLRVPVGKSVQVTIIRADGAYVSGVVSSNQGQRAEAGATVDLTGASKDTTGVTGIADKDVLDGDDTFEIPDSTDDEEWTFDFSFGDGSGDDGKPDPGPGPDDPDKPTGPSTPAVTFTVTPVAVLGADGKAHGSISPGSPVSVPRGESYSFSFKCDNGYRVEAVTANGKRLVEGHVDSYLLRDIQEDTELRVTFTTRTEEDSIAPIKRPIHRLQSLAQTGDATLPLALALAAFVCGALGVLFMIGRRPKREADEQ